MDNPITWNIFLPPTLFATKKSITSVLATHLRSVKACASIKLVSNTTFQTISEINFPISFLSKILPHNEVLLVPTARGYPFLIIFTREKHESFAVIELNVFSLGRNLYQLTSARLSVNFLPYWLKRVINISTWIYHTYFRGCHLYRDMSVESGTVIKAIEIAIPTAVSCVEIERKPHSLCSKKKLPF